jgi:hypothetical protein
MATGLSTYTQWNKLDLPNPEEYDNVNEEYVEKVNSVFLNAIKFILCHEFSHVYLGHVDLDNSGIISTDEEIKKDEYAADNYAISVVLKGVTDEQSKTNICAGVIAGLCSLLFLDKELAKTTHPDSDLRIKNAIEQFHLKEEDNIFSGGKKDIASLYEYWVFFVLFKTLTDKYTSYSTLDPKRWLDSLLVPDSNGLGLYLQEGRKQAFEFEWNSGKRPLKIKFYYNRSFPGWKKYEVSKKAGSYTNPFRPDYSLSIWPKEISEDDAEEQEKIVHIHFDAKYKIENLNPYVSNSNEEKTEEQIEEEAAKEIENTEKEERQGTFKNVDLYKMHAYKDAIRRTGGAYILYPGKSSVTNKFKGFHEIIPGVGAFSLRPSIEEDSTKNIGDFIDEIINNLEDVLSQRERIAKKQYAIIKDEPQLSQDIKLINIAHEIGLNEDLDETYVLIGYCKSQKQYDWISSTARKYNIRFGNNNFIDGKMATAKYLVLYEKVGNDIQFKNNIIFELNHSETKLISDQDLIKLNYPTKPSSNQYLLYTIQNEISLEDFKYNFHDGVKELKNKLLLNSKKELPFAISLIDLLKIRN